MNIIDDRYSDPLDILIRQEEKTCKGCKYRVKIWQLEICSKHNVQPIFRCDSYIEGIKNAAANKK